MCTTASQSSVLKTVLVENIGQKVDFLKISGWYCFLFQSQYHPEIFFNVIFLELRVSFSHVRHDPLYLKLVIEVKHWTA
jgi:hypothetical protein